MKDALAKTLQALGLLTVIVGAIWLVNYEIKQAAYVERLEIIIKAGLNCAAKPGLSL